MTLCVIWNVATGECEAVLKGHTDWVNSALNAGKGVAGTYLSMKILGIALDKGNNRTCRVRRLYGIGI
jgi:hypothetical protein